MPRTKPDPNNPPDPPPQCPSCTSSEVSRNGRKNGFQQYICRNCKHPWSDNPRKGRGGHNKREDGLSAAAEWKKKNRDKCTERDRLRRQERREAERKEDLGER